MKPRLLNSFPLEGALTNWARLEAEYPTLVANLSATPQDPYYHSEGDVWTHTKMVVNALTQGVWYSELSEDDRRTVWLGALLHDIGKPATTVHEENGRISSKGHSLRGAQDARIWLWNEGIPFVQREMVGRLIQCHQEPFYTIRKDDYSSCIRRMSHFLRTDLLGTMTKADAEGRWCTPADLRQDAIDGVELFRLGCEDLGVWGHRAPFADSYTWQKFLNSPKTVDPVYPIRRPKQGSPVIVLSGLPGMGKNTWVEQHARSLPVVSYDDTREALGVGHGEQVGEVVHAVWDQAKGFLRRGEPFVWNATHIVPSLRKKALDLCWNYDAEVRLVYLETSTPQLWRKQNRQRAASVPDAALDHLLYRWEPPSFLEAEHVEYWIDGMNRTQDMEMGLGLAERVLAGPTLD